MNVFQRVQVKCYQKINLGVKILKFVHDFFNMHFP